MPDNNEQTDGLAIASFHLGRAILEYLETQDAGCTNQIVTNAMRPLMEIKQGEHPDWPHIGLDRALSDLSKLRNG